MVSFVLVIIAPYVLHGEGILVPPVLELPRDVLGEVRCRYITACDS